jgi:predicted Zn-dependent protease
MYTDALRNLKDALATGYEGEGLHYDLAMVHLELEELDKAQAEISLEIQAFPENATYRVLKGDVHLRAKDYAMAITSYNQALKIAPNLPEAQKKRQQAEELKEMSVIHGYARSLLLHEAKTGAVPTKDVAFKECKVPFKYLSKVMEYISKEEALDF